MNEKMTNVASSARNMWQNASKKARVTFLLVTAGILIFCIAAVLILNHTNYELLFNVNSLSAQESAGVIAALNEAGIEPKVENSGAIYVAEKDIDEARMYLAMQGYSNSGLTYDRYNETAGSLTATQSDRNQAALHDLQDRLQATIETFDQVNKAIVTISIPEQGVFALESQNIPPSASVQLIKKPGTVLTNEQVRGIVNIVKHSVSGLSEDNISVSDETGDLKTFMESTSAASGKLELTEQVNNSIKNNVLSILQPVYGPENVRVAVFTTLDTDARVREQTTYEPIDPENPQNNPLDYSEHDRSKSGGADPAQGVPGANDNVNVPQYNAQDMNVADGDFYTANDVYDYLVSNVREQIVSEGLLITDVSVAVVVNTAQYPNFAGEQGSVIQLVRSAAGLPVNDTETLRSNITVQGLTFQIVDDGSPSTWIDSESDAFPWVIALIVAAGVALLIVLLIVILAIRGSRRRKREALAQQAMIEEGGEMLVDLAGEEQAAGDDFEPITLEQTQEQKLKAQIRDLAQSDPEIVAQLLKTWLVNG